MKAVLAVLCVAAMAVPVGAGTHDLERPRPAAPAEHEMIAGRLAKLPVSFYWKGTRRIGEAGRSHHFEVQTFNCSGDSGLLVHVKTASGGHVASLYNDDVAPGGGGTGPKSSHVDARSRMGALEYDVYVFSQTRATTFCSVWYRVSGDAWTFWLADHFGGTLVDVGPMPGADFLEVQTFDNGADPRNDTQMVLFDLGTAGCTGAAGQVCAGTHAPQVGNDRMGDRDPRVPVAGAPPVLRVASRNLALLGKVSRTIASNRSVETRVDLVHHPLGSGAGSVGGFPSSGGLGRPGSFAPGRYYVWLYAAADSPVGSYDTVPLDAAHPGDDMDPVSTRDCRTGEGPTGADNYSWYYRGTANSMAFLMHLERGNGCTGTACTSWTAVDERWVPRAALGGAKGEGWNLFLLELEADHGGVYRLRTTNHTANIRFFDEWRYERNPDASELKLVTYNAYYNLGDQLNKWKNASNLLATRGEIVTSSMEVREAEDQARFQWDADILGFQEMDRRCNSADQFPAGTDCTWDFNHHGYAEAFQVEAQAKGPLLWDYVRGKAEDSDWSDLGLAPLFVNQLFWPNPGNAASMFFTSADKQNAGCETDGSKGLDRWLTCYLAGFDEWGTLNQRGVGGKAQVNRYGTSADRPITVFNVHLEYRGIDSDDRHQELLDLVGHLKRLLAANPAAFNSAPASDAGRTHPKHFQNRIVILGDINALQHGCGEHYALVKMLREEFGYAVDLGMAALDASGRGNGGNMHHYKGASYSPAGVPFGYQSIAAWQDMCRADPTAAHRLNPATDFPWWAATYRGGESKTDKCGRSERHDAIYLVGKGWAYDDPLLQYAVMSDRDDPSPMHPEGGGVEVIEVANNVSATYGGRPNYRPNHKVHAGPSPGATALNSDHLPVGARIRVYQR
jgi:hypothetical protein